MKTLVSSLLIFCITAAARLAAADSLDAGRQLLDAAVAEVVAVGGERAARNFVTDSRWRVGSMYVVMNDFRGTVLAHSANPKMVGKVMLEARDASGKLFVQEGLRNIRAHGESLIDLKWGNPLTDRIAPAHMLSERIPGRELYVSVLVFNVAAPAPSVAATR